MYTVEVEHTVKVVGSIWIDGEDDREAQQRAIDWSQEDISSALYSSFGDFEVDLVSFGDANIISCILEVNEDMDMW